MYNIDERVRSFSINGLTKVAVRFLDQVDDLWFDGHQGGISLLEDAMDRLDWDVVPREHSQTISEAWDYWNFLKRPYIRESLRSPVPLSSLVNVMESGSWFRGRDNNYVLNSDIKEILNLMITNDYYFELIEDRFYLKFNSILGGRFIARVIDDMD